MWKMWDPNIIIEQPTCQLFVVPQSAVMHILWLWGKQLCIFHAWSGTVSSFPFWIGHFACFKCTHLKSVISSQTLHGKWKIFRLSPQMRPKDTMMRLLCLWTWAFVLLLQYILGLTLVNSDRETRMFPVAATLTCFHQPIRWQCGARFPDLSQTALTRVPSSSSLCLQVLTQFDFGHPNA